MSQQQHGNCSAVLWGPGWATAQKNQRPVIRGGARLADGLWRQSERLRVINGLLHKARKQTVVKSQGSTTQRLGNGEGAVIEV